MPARAQLGRATTHPHAEEGVAADVARHQQRVMRHDGRRTMVLATLGHVGQGLESGG